ncbi:AfsR/SARP family transcriptional regulator [Candidatus Leptofilum sp.]|uniref:AfsR/SARP family transcriptional regulator n=1 Tax=Candidatus Leptofilum sp. TaxID=3241576 RepID=UPI003B5B3D10
MKPVFAPKQDIPPAPALPGWKNDWQNAVEFLIANNYEQVIAILSHRQTAASTNGEARLEALLEAAIQICEACAQHQSQVELHSQAMTQSLQRQQQLQQQMLAFLTTTINSAAAEEANGSANQTAVAKQPSPTTMPPAPNLWPQPKEIATRPSLAVYLLGSFRVFVNGRLVSNWSGNKCKSIFKHMIMNRHRPVRHDVLMEQFWPDETPDAAKRNMYQTVYLLRQALQQDDSDFQFILCQDGTYSFNDELDIWVDSALFEEQYAHGLQLEKEGDMETAVQAYATADELYAGDFLAEDIYEEWTLVHRERIKHAHLDLLDRISQHYWKTQQYSQCVTVCKKILQGDSCREDIHRRLMRAYLHQGQRHLAIRQYHHCVELLAQELDVEPMPATRQLFNQIVNGEPLTS